MRTPIIGVIGGSEMTDELGRIAEEVGGEIAKRGWSLVTGGLGGAMEAASKGAREAGGTVIGILPTPSTSAANPYVTVPIATNMGHARNAIIAHTADAVVAVGGAFGTLSEIALANALGKKVYGLHSWDIDGVAKRASVAAIMDELDRMMTCNT